MELRGIGSSDLEDRMLPRPNSRVLQESWAGNGWLPLLFLFPIQSQN